MTSDDDRIAYLAGDTARPVDPGDREELDGLRALLADPSTWEEPSPALEDRVMATVAVASGARPSPAPGARSRRFRPGLLYTAFAAAAVVIAVAVVTLRGTGNSPTQFKAALAAPNTAGAQGGAPAAPRAAGDATLTQTAAGWRIALNATGLPRLDNGRYYQAWLKNAAGILVPVGTFNQGPSVTLWAGVPPTDFPTLTVTEQQVGRGQASSGQRVLTGSVDLHR
ncbi:MAG TPA: anti-sigma factor [Streptosporangiaceae bacterium]|nr:anti-sigma factor [Streptosporangiaceae bacterium]